MRVTTDEEAHREALAEIKRLRRENRNLLSELRVAQSRIVELKAALPHCLTHCSECNREFPEPVEQWDDYFTDVEDVAFMCHDCADDFDGTTSNVR